MGIPSFYRWLVDRYPRAVIDAIEESSNGVIDTSSPNPNGIEFDNLYLDMNGIIHPCFHPENLSPPTTYDEVFQAVFKYIDRLFSIVRPRKLLYMAIDGVAPRAKMNQQRARRFRAAKDLADQESATERLLNVPVTHSNEENNKLDSNIITPGTEFMELLASALQYYIHLRMNNDPGWKGIKVIFSGASVPGEGEHKIVSFIRLQRNLPGFDPNTRHCLYGLDADLIMLALATHEVHFTVLREVGQKSQTVDQRKRLRSGNRKPNQGKNFANEFDKCLAEQVFQLVRIWVLRDYLAHELQIPAPNTSTDFERLIDDFVFMCIFVGNDFLPHIPSLEIGEGGIDLLMMTYKQEFVQMGGYLTMSSEVNLRRVEHFIKAIGSYELPIFRKRNLVMEVRGRKGMYSHRSSAEHNCHKTQEKELIKAEDNLTIEKVDFGKDGWKERYYALKFEIENDDKGELIRKDAVNKYVEGICWVMRYYYQGICSWNWFYPYHYAPFASDFQGIGQLEMWFDLGRPLKPFDQLMGVLPAASAQALPFFYRQLMTDSSSPILDFYPKDFEVDLNGKRHSWEGVCKLPFINEFRLLAEIAKVEHTLTDSEVRRNTLGQDVLFIYQTHPLAKIILSFWKEVKDNAKLPDSAVRKEIIDPVLRSDILFIMPDLWLAYS
ncbi:hypothetical protein Leryth_004645 [Lithospermum erythrorhizon]|nr:hypothetical protein Leryth_004645 [Lithospermum erythrorhizon]